MTEENLKPDDKKDISPSAFASLFSGCVFDVTYIHHINDISDSEVSLGCGPEEG